MLIINDKPYNDIEDLVIPLKDPYIREWGIQHSFLEGYIRLFKQYKDTLVQMICHSCPKPYNRCSNDGRVIVNIPSENSIIDIHSIFEFKKQGTSSVDTCVKAAFAQASMYNWIEKEDLCNCAFIGTEKFLARVYITEELRHNTWEVFQTCDSSITPCKVWKENSKIRKVLANLTYDIWRVDESFNYRDIVETTIEHFI